MNNETCQCECKNYCMWKTYYGRNPTTCICENGMYLKSIADDSKIACDEIKNATDSASTNVLTNLHNKNIKI